MPVTVPARFVSVRVRIARLSLAEYPVFILVVVNVLLVSVFMITSIVPTVVGQMYRLHV